MKVLDRKEFSEDTKYNLPSGNIIVMSPTVGSVYDLLFTIIYGNYTALLGYKLNDNFKFLSFSSFDISTPITANDYLDAEILVRLLAPSLKEYAQKIMNTTDFNAPPSTIILGNN